MLQLAWRDVDGDMIVIGSSAELLEAVASCAGDTLRLYTQGGKSEYAIMSAHNVICMRRGTAVGNVDAGQRARAAVATEATRGEEVCVC